jgi:transcriptional regulator with GAF, ATPase, and Fis domain/tetratricopeptide (TPR) repeat protein
MTLVAHPLPSRHPHLVAGGAAIPRGFVELDDRVSRGAGGVAIVRAPSREAAEAIGAHVTRRARAAGMFAIEAKARWGAPLWREVASRIGIGALGSDPAGAAEAIARAASQRRAHVVAPLPRPGSWDRAVATEMASLAAAGPVVFIVAGLDAADDLHAEVYEVGATLEPAERQRWWAALGEAAHIEVTADSLASLDAWWSNARACSAARPEPAAALSSAGERLLALLSLASRAWPRDELPSLGADEATLEALAQAGAVRASGGWVVVEPAWEARAEGLAAKSSVETIGAAVRALSARFPDDAWAHARAAELLVRVGSSEAMQAADGAQARALAQAEDSLARRELVTAWMAAVGTLPREAQLALRAKSAERALALGEAEEAFRWAQSAAALAPHDPQVTLLFGRAAVALGDLVAAKVALQRGALGATDACCRAVIAAELAEVAYLGGDFAAAAREAERALSLDDAMTTRLKARNTLGKLLLADSSWDRADVHFAEDQWAAAAAGLRTEELRARLNRGIALLSKGLVDEARSVFEVVLAEGERLGDARAVAFALDNLSVLATLRHDYAQALPLAERTLKLRQRIGDRLATARVLCNLAELRRRLGLLDHAEHAVAFGRRTLGPGMPPSRSALFSLQAARNALLRGNTVEARREAYRALTESEAASTRKYQCEAYRIATRIALEDGDLIRVAELLERGAPLVQSDEARAEWAILTAQHARACGDESDNAAIEALAAARTCGKEDLIIEAHVLLGEIHRCTGRIETARAHVEGALALRERVASTLPNEVRGAFLSRPDLVALGKLHATLTERSSASEAPPPSEPLPRSSLHAVAASREIVGDDPAIRGLLAAVRKVACSSSTVLVRGESGTGKELVAEAIHRASDRASGPLVTVNCAALVETLLLSELFGHEKGAFTGAVVRRRGRFELAEGGTLFLDEIGDISARTQVALLRVLQERTFERVGGTAPLRANVRVICATHRDLRAMVERGEFREDLYYRLRGITLEVPPLRARMGDLPRISDHLLARISVERGECKKTLTADAIELLGRHRWPGNVRELENALRAASLFAEGEFISSSVLLENVDDLRALRSVRLSSAPRSAGGDPQGRASADEAAGEGGDADGAEGELPGGPLPSGEASATAVAYAQVRSAGTSLPDIKRQIERDCVARALAETRGNITRAAALLGMKRPRLSQLVKQYGLAAVQSEGS